MNVQHESNQNATQTTLPSPWQMHAPTRAEQAAQPDVKGKLYTCKSQAAVSLTGDNTSLTWLQKTTLCYIFRLTHSVGLQSHLLP